MIIKMTNKNKYREIERMYNLTRVYFGDRDDNRSDNGEGAGNDQQVYVII